MTSPTITFLGPVGTYTHQAAYNRFGPNAVYNECSSISDIFASLASHQIGVVPQENTTFGSVIETYDCLRRSESFFVLGETTLAIQHCLLVRTGTKISDIDCIMSHEQALGQCSTFIGQHLPGVSIKKTSSTAAAARAVLSGPSNTAAAICSKICATIFEGTEILREGIQNQKDNFTRFYIISQDSSISIPQPSAATEQSALLRLRPVPPETDLINALQVLNLQVRRIDRRPALDAPPFHDIYFVEVYSKGVSPSWKDKIEKGRQRVQNLGAVIELVGLW
ncbi:PDT-domain-containing protein [Hymenopellis radicata]|nr:PDT-domain-containing protein [Hymenopellis radicata]